MRLKAHNKRYFISLEFQYVTLTEHLEYDDSAAILIQEETD